MEKQRVLIISTSAGTGHVRAAQALEKEFSRDPRVAEVVHEDALKFTNKLFREFYSSLYLKLVRSAPSVLGWFYRASDEPWKGEAVRTQLDRLNTRSLVKFIREFQPHLIVCTHFMPAGIISHLLEKGEIQTRHAITVTDFDCHAMWLTHCFHRYFVALEETKAHLEALGLPPERVTVSGIPIDPVFAEKFDRAAIRKSFGLDPKRTTLLLSAGALGVGPTELLVERLNELQHPFQCWVVCGKNPEIRERVEAAARDFPKRFCVLGYTDRMHELMHASDLYIGKPGGLTTSEAMACGLPLAVFAPIPGQEERNSDHLLENGAAIRCNELTTLAFKLDQLFASPGRLIAMRKAAKVLGRPHAARKVVATLLEDRLPTVALESEQREAMTQAAARAAGR
ncbi:MGDG synthase family glycosyltransferase [Oleiharenicola lentus]|uniref:MGDG synthase family glycosyltransferase n=1 Tax=Oleiharenicola lentus TaxID=2508720 RepID=UPI003F67FFEF